MEFNSRIIYSAPQSQFFKDVMLNKVVGKMVESSAKINLSPGKPELNSWNNNVRHVKDLIELSEVNDTYVTFEYFIPYSRKRIDCVLYGQDKDNKKNVVHIELKQWSNTGMTVLKRNTRLKERINPELKTVLNVMAVSIPYLLVPQEDYLGMVADGSTQYNITSE